MTAIPSIKARLSTSAACANVERQRVGETLEQNVICVFISLTAARRKDPRQGLSSTRSIHQYLTYFFWILARSYKKGKDYFRAAGRQFIVVCWASFVHKHPP